MKRFKVILASGSPRRKQILKELRIPFEACAPRMDETLRPWRNPARLARMLALEKARSSLVPGALVIGMDTLVVARGKILGKPADAVEAIRMLKSLSGRTHQVITGVALLLGTRSAAGSATTRVAFRKLTVSEMEWYVSTGEPMDKAGAYGIQGLARIFITRIDGCYFNVVGFPVDCFQRLLRRLGIRMTDLIR
jgi:septum formation protein